MIKLINWGGVYRLMAFQTWYIATRPWSLVMTFVSVCLGGVVSYSIGNFNPGYFFLAMLGLIIAHMAANMTNDYYDVRDGVDSQSPTAQFRPHPLLHNELSKRGYKAVIAALYAVGFTISLYFTWVRGLQVLAFTVLGVFLGIFYTADPIKLKYRSIGEISVFLVWGPLIVGGVYYVLTGVFSIEPMLKSIPVGLLVALVVYSNNLRDTVIDAKMGIKTITTNRTAHEGFTLYKILLASAYASTIVLIAGGLLSIFSLIVFFTVVEANKILKQFSEKIPLNSDQITSQLTLHFGLLLVTGELIALILRIV